MNITFRIKPLRLTVLVTAILLVSLSSLLAQNTLGGGTGDPSAVLDLQSNSQGVLLSRMTTAERSAIVSPATGLLIYNTSLGCVEVNTGSSSHPVWRCMVRAGGSISSLECVDALLTGDLYGGQAAEGVEVSIPYAGGNGQWYNRQQVVSTGVTGLVATLSAGAFANGIGNLTYFITGTPSAVGTASFALSIGGQSCMLDITVSVPPAEIAALDCAGATHTGTITARIAVGSGVSTLVSYTGGNGGAYDGQTINSTGVTGLTATLMAGTLTSGSGNLTYTITGTPSSGGTASFLLEIGGQSCTLTRTVDCGAYVASGVWKQFMCHNLGANESADPFTPSWELIGNYYQWGRNPTCFGRDGTDAANPCSSPVYGVAAPWGNATTNDNAGGITGWNNVLSASAAITAWVDGSKTTDDPCPTGWRVPTVAQLTNLANNTLNPRTSVGTWTENSTNYGSGFRLGTSLFLPAAGGRNPTSGAQYARGAAGYYWSSNGKNVSNTQLADLLYFNSGTAEMVAFSRIYGYSVRCIKE